MGSVAGGGRYDELVGMYQIEGEVHWDRKRDLKKGRGIKGEGERLTEREWD